MFKRELFRWGLRQAVQSGAAVALVAFVMVVSAPEDGAAADSRHVELLPSTQPQALGLLDSADVDAIAELLAVRSQAVMSNDLVAHQLTIAEGASDRFRNIEQRTVEGAESIGLDAFSESVALPAIDLAPPGLTSAAGEPVVVLSVTRRLQISDADAWPTAVTLYFSFVKTSAGWLVLDDDDLAMIGLVSDRALWEFRDVDVVRSDRTVVIGTSGLARLEQVAAHTETAIDRFDVNWGQPWQGSVVVIVPTNLEEVEELLRPTGDASRFVAFTTLDVDRGSGWDVVSPRVVTQESNFARRSASRQIDILVHELAHVASVQSSGPATPLWFHEGLADWITAGRPATTGEAVTFPDLYLFRTGTAAEIATVYDQAERAMAQLSGEFGDDVPWKLFVEVGNARSTPGSSDYLVAEAIETITGSTP